MIRRVLIITSSYCPTMLADMHRARHLAWELPKFDWEPEILSPGTAYQPPSSIDRDSADFFPQAGKVGSIGPFLPSVFRLLRIRGSGWRAFIPMFLAGNRRLRVGVDLIYFSTTQFSLFLLGPIWRLWFGTPYVLDLHDPCVKEDLGTLRRDLRFRDWLVQKLSRRIEAVAVRHATGLVSVSPHYLETMSARYLTAQPAWAFSNRAVVIPFAALQRDLTEAARGAPPVCADREGVRIIYVGAGGPIMARSFALLCDGLATVFQLKPHLRESVRIELYGTMLDSAPVGGPRYLAELGARSGLAGIILEEPERVSYRRSLELLLAADGAIILGVDDAGYMPSKLMSYALSGKPLLAVLRRDGPAYRMFEQNTSFGQAIWFDNSAEMPKAEVATVVASFLAQCNSKESFDRRSALRPYLAPAMARRHVELFGACLNRV
ncbi:MAG TPA: glycosyltransferase [Xanthobacteraceae bacterium]|nr:glycosyltransferase [Xanthobacteraceae bacterium]